jgi:hypothetical protein
MEHASMIVIPSSGLTFDGKRIYTLPQAPDPGETCYFGPPVKQKIMVETEQHGHCTVIRPERFQRVTEP